MSLLTSIMTGGVNNHPTTSDEANAWSTDFISEGIVGSFSGGPPLTGAFATTAQGTPDMTVAVATGVCYVQGTPTSQSSQTFRVKNTASSNVTIAANSSGSTKYDWVYIKLDATKLNGPSVAGDDAATLTTSRSTSQSSDDGTPPTYGYPIAVVTVANGATSITSGNIRDSRANCIVNLGSSSVSSGWTELGYAPNTITALGNRSYSLVFNSTDLTGTTSVGQRLKLPRTVTAPTQCADLEAGSSQYFSKASATGLATGTTWTWKAKIKPESYAAMTIAAIDDGTNRMEIRLNASGQIVIAGGTAAAEDLVTSYQSVALNKVQDISGSITIGTPTGEIIVDDVVWPSFVTASAATTMTIGTPTIYIGRNAAGNYFDGLVGHVFLFNAIISAATLKTYSGQIGIGSETSLEGYWSLNGVLTDASSNANTLTGSGGAVATNAYSLFTNPVTGTSVTAGTTNYGIIMAQTFSTNTTYTIQVPEGETLPTTGGIGTVSYSTQANPYGIPSTDSITRYSRSILNTSAPSLTNSSQDLASCGLVQIVTASEGAIAQVRVDLGIGSTTDFEFRPEVRLGGTVVKNYTPNATLASAGGRASTRGFTWNVPLVAGANTISAGVELNSSTGPILNIGAGAMTVTIVKGYGSGN